MRIGTLNSINQIYNANGLSKSKYTNSTGNANFKDEVLFSSLGKDIQVAKNALISTPDVRESLVSDIKSRMDAGTYEVSYEDFAAKLVSAFASKAI